MEPESGPLEEPVQQIESATDSEERILPYSPDSKYHFHLIHKFSRWPIWKALNKASEQALPRWAYPSEPTLVFRKSKGVSYAVWEYGLPQYFLENPKTVVKIKPGGGKTFKHEYDSIAVRISTHVKAESKEGLEKLKLMDKTIEEKIREARGKAVNQWHEDVFRVTILWESICAALAASYYVWNRYYYHFGGDNEEAYLKYLEPFFEAVGIDVQKVWRFAGNPYYGKGKKDQRIQPITDFYRLKANRKKFGKLSKREREKRNREYDAEMLRKTNALEALVNEQREQDLKAFEAKYGKVSKSKLKKSPEYAASMQAKWDEFRVAKWNEPVAQTGIATETKSPRSRKVKQKNPNNSKVKRIKESKPIKSKNR